MKNKKHVITRTNRAECGAVCQNDRLSAGHIWQTRSHVYGEVKCQAEVRSDVVIPNKLDNDKTCKGLLRRFVHKITNNNEISPHNDMIIKTVKNLFPYFPISLSPKKIIDSSPNALALNGYGSALMLELVRLRMTAFTLAEGATHVDLPPTKVKFAFTLAEVLITLGIIGVVAAMTIPNLMSNYRKHIAETRILRTYSIITQAIKIAEEEWGDGFSSDGFKGDKDIVDAGDVNGYSWELSHATFEKYFKPSIRTIHSYPKEFTFDSYNAKTGAKYNSQYRFFAWYDLLDGSRLGFVKAGNYGGVQFIIIPEPNKKKLIEGVDLFLLEFQQRNGVYEYFPLYYDAYRTGRITNDDLVEYCGDDKFYPAYASSIASYCFFLLKVNGYKFPANYPIKF